jgi:hypothetical protein
LHQERGQVKGTKFTNEGTKRTETNEGPASVAQIELLAPRAARLRGAES